MSYRESAEELEQLQNESKYRELWMYSYTNRHVRMNSYFQIPLDETEAALDQAEEMLKKYNTDIVAPENGNHSTFIRQFNEFLFSLIYAHHRKNYNDGFIDIRFQDQFQYYDKLLNKLTNHEARTIKHLHKLSHQFGYLVSELLLPQDSKHLKNCFIEEFPQDPHKLSPPPIYSFPKKSDHPKGIQIILSPYQAKILKNWDLVIFYRKGDTIFDIQNKLNSSWDLKGKQIIGVNNLYEIALYIERKECTKKRVISALNTQIFWRGIEKNGRMVSLPTNGDISDLEQHLPKESSQLKNNIRAMVGTLSFSEKLEEKRWPYNKNNTRRAIGLYLWDEVNTLNSGVESVKSLVQETIEQIRSDKPEILSLYNGKFNKPVPSEPHLIFGDKPDHYNTVVREMEADYAMTDYCIKIADYVSPSKAKKERKNQV